MSFEASDFPAGATFFHEKRLHQRGIHRIAGIDEVGRGPLAGPVVAAAVILPMEIRLPGLKDSKKLTARQREDLCSLIEAEAQDVAIGFVDAHEIDRINILQTTFKAMLKAVEGLRILPQYLLIDGPYKLPMPIGQTGITRGDQVCSSIAAASIVAKVHRDRMMAQYDEMYPAYGFAKNKGYGTAAHCIALEKWGPCPVHRKSFRPVANHKARESSYYGKQAE